MGEKRVVRRKFKGSGRYLFIQNYDLAGQKFHETRFFNCNLEGPWNYCNSLVKEVLFVVPLLADVGQFALKDSIDDLLDVGLEEGVMMALLCQT